MKGRRNRQEQRVWAVVLAAAWLGFSLPALGGGPLVVTTDGTPVGWGIAKPVRYHTDLGSLGLLDNAQAMALANTLFDEWEDIPTATIEFDPAGSTTMDIDETNFGPFLGPFGGFTSPVGQSVIVFDSDGAIFDTLFGIGTGVVGFADPTFFSDGVSTIAFGDPVPPGAKIIEGMAFLNGKMIDGVENPANGNREITPTMFAAAFLHEVGHFVGLHHTQIHGLRDHPPESDMHGLTQPIETMFPLIIDEGQRSLERDDVVALSVLYPNTDFFASTGSVSGQVRTSDGSPLSGINVTARNLADDSDAVSFVSGTTLVPAGGFSLHGLTPGASYRIQIQEVDPFFRGGSRLPPFDPPIPLPGPPEYYSGLTESSDPATDDPRQFEVATVLAGEALEGVDVVLNSQSFSVKNALVGNNTRVTDIAVGDFDGDGIVDFVGAGPEIGFYRGLGGGEFAAPVTVDEGDWFVISGQFNLELDSFLDIAVASVASSDVRVYFGDGTGGFGAPTTILDGPDGLFQLYGFTSGDLNGDPFRDLVTVVRDTDGGTAAVHSLLGSATGDFLTVVTDLVVGSGFPVSALAVAQIAGSSDADLIGIAGGASSILPPGPPALGLLLGNGAGGFVPAPPVSLASISISITDTGLGLGDFDENGTVDVVLANTRPVGKPPNFTRSWIDLLLGDGSGNFNLAARYFVPEAFQANLAVADLNGDGHLDIASTGATAGLGFPGAKVNMVLGDGAGGVGEVVTIWGLLEFPNLIKAADLDDDESIDLLVSVSQSGAIGLGVVGTYAALINGLEQVCLPVTTLSCESQRADVLLSWTHGDSYSSVEVHRNSKLIATLSKGTTGYTDEALPAGSYIYEVVGDCGPTVALAATCTLVHDPGPDFIRGDANGDGTFDGFIDGLYILEFQFQNGKPPLCMEAADADDNGVFNGLVDGLHVLEHQFLGGAPPSAPYPACGQDPEPGTSLGCESHPGCA